eukprot:TRINITY_DN7940_c0_g4_i1.p1 TRINITY_DN7940_c0_g4~~TRINITY_DN7940_c0_g4_i1.p1  ORF type:complete len:826 (+),score=209.38 TRINITY_DN7940_c0_g4_i1:225-2702(+)
MSDILPKIQLENADGYDEVAARVKPSSEAAWDIPSGSIAEMLEEWIECEFDKQRGFIKAKNLPNAASEAPGAFLDVKDSYAGNTETCMRRHAEQDASKGNVLCFVKNGAKAVKMIERWVECKWRGHRSFVKARHVKAAPKGAVLLDILVPSDTPALPARHGGGSSSSSSGVAKPAAHAGVVKGDDDEKDDEKEDDEADDEEGEEEIAEPPAKKAKTGHADVVRARCKYGAGCYQKNPLHKAKFSHPGDADWDGVPDAKAAKPPVEAAAIVAEVTEAVPEPAEAAADGPDHLAEAPLPPLPKEAVPLPVDAPKAVHTGEPVPAVVDGPAGTGENRDCDCCFDNIPLTGGIFCPGKGHFFCSSCLANFLVSFKTADFADQKKGKGRALCPMKDSETPFSDAALVGCVPQDVFDDYLQIRIKVAEKVIQEQFEKEHTSKIEELKEKLAKASGSEEQMALDKHRLSIIDDIFTLKCPRCKLAFLDYDNCSAISCAGCKCGFCSYCLEDCGKDAHQHFYKNKSMCPNGGGPLFIEHKKWQEFQSKRKGVMLCEYLSTVPEELRKKVADLVAPDAKDLGIEMPEDLSGVALAPEAHGVVRLKLEVPWRLRARLLEKSKELLKTGVVLTMADTSSKVKISTVAGFAGSPPVIARKAPLLDASKKNIAARLPDGHEVLIEDDWVNAEASKGKLSGFVKTKHVAGKFKVGGTAVLREAGGHGSVMVRKMAKQDEGKNSLGFLDDGTEIKVVSHWMECSWDGAGPAKTGFIEARHFPEDDVILRGLEDECWSAVPLLEKAIDISLKACRIDGHGKAKGKGDGKAKKGKGRGRGRG